MNSFRFVGNNEKMIQDSFLERRDPSKVYVVSYKHPFDDKEYEALSLGNRLAETIRKKVPQLAMLEIEVAVA